MICEISVHVYKLNWIVVQIYFILYMLLYTNIHHVVLLYMYILQIFDAFYLENIYIDAELRPFRLIFVTTTTTVMLCCIYIITYL